MKQSHSQPPDVATSIRSSEKLDRPTQLYNSAVGPPPLQYPIESKTKALVLTWSVIIFTNTVLPVTLFYVLRHGEDTRARTSRLEANIPGVMQSFMPQPISFSTCHKYPCLLPYSNSHIDFGSWKGGMENVHHAIEAVLPGIFSSGNFVCHVFPVLDQLGPDGHS